MNEMSQEDDGLSQLVLERAKEPESKEAEREVFVDDDPRSAAQLLDESFTVPDGVDDGLGGLAIIKQLAEDDAADDGLSNLPGADERIKDDTKQFIANEHNRIINAVSTEFGAAPVTRDTTVIGDMFGRNNQQALDALGMSNSTDTKRLLQEISNFTKQNPDAAATEEGVAMLDDLNQRILNASKVSDEDYTEVVNQLFQYAQEDTGGFLDMLWDEAVASPATLLASVAAYSTGGVLGGAGARTLGLRNFINAGRRSSSARMRLSALALDKVTKGAGIALTEGSVAAADQYSRNVTTERDSLLNVLTMAEVGAVLSLATVPFTTLTGIIKGHASLAGAAKLADVSDAAEIKRIAPKAAQILQQDGFEAGVAYLSKHTGWAPSEITKLLMTKLDELPHKQDGVEAGTARMNEIHGQEGAALKPQGVETLDNSTIVNLVNSLGSDPLFEGSALRTKNGTRFTSGIEDDGTIFYNFRNLRSDLEAGLNSFQGKNKDGTLGKSNHDTINQAAFADIDFERLTKWIYNNGGIKKYAAFDLKYQAYLKKFRKTEPNEGIARRKAFEKTLEANKLSIKDVATLSRADKIYNGLSATVNTVAKKSADLLTNPQLIYKPLLNNLRDTGGFIKDLYTGEKGMDPGRLANNRKIRNNVDSLLRDAAGNKIISELEINLFQQWQRGLVKDPTKRVAIAHYIEGGLDRYNARRVRKGLKEVVLDENDLKVASVSHRFLKDMHDVAQRGELLNVFKNDQIKYNKARAMVPEGAIAGAAINEYTPENIWGYVEGLKDPGKVADHITTEKQREKGTGPHLGYIDRYVPIAVKNRFADTEEGILGSSLADGHAASRLQTKSKFFNPREKFDSMMDAVDSGQPLHSQDISVLTSMYAKSMIRSHNNLRFLSQLSKVRDAEGNSMVMTKDTAPAHYVEFTNENFRDSKGEFMHVNPNVAPDLKLYFDTSDPLLLNRIAQNIIMISKRAALGFSGFHMMALAVSGVNAGQPLGSVLKNLLPLGKNNQSDGLKALYGGHNYEAIQLLVRNGLGIGVLEELKGDTLINAMRNTATWVDEIFPNGKYVKPLGKVVSSPIRGLAKAQEVIDTHLWDHVNTGLKTTTALTTLENMVRQDVIDAKKEGRPPTDMNHLAQRAAQYTNDAFGNQNWGQMAMNVQNTMGHRFAAALNKPSMRGYIRMLVFAPDWTLSNLRVMGKMIDTKDKSHEAYAKYAMRSAMMFAMVGESLQQMMDGTSFLAAVMAGEGFRVKLGDDKYMDISKQLTEVLRIFTKGPGDFVKHKLGTAPKSYMESETPTDAVKYWGINSLPISARSGDVAGSLGLPTSKWNR